MNKILKSLCLIGLLTGSTLALTPEQKLGKMNDAFAEGNTAAAEKWGLEMLADGDETSVRLVAEYMADCGYSPKLRQAALEKAAEMKIQIAGSPTEGAPWRLDAAHLAPEYEDLSAANDAAGIRALGMELYRRKASATQRYGIGLLYVAASMGDAEALRQLAAMYRKGADVPRDAECAEYLIDLIGSPSTGSNAVLHEVFNHCLSRGGTPDIIRERGVDFAEGRYGVEASEKAAVILYHVAADMGDARAARWMGWRYLQGRGVKKNRKLAEVFFTIAAIQGEPQAREALKQQFGKTVEATN